MMFIFGGQSPRLIQAHCAECELRVPVGTGLNGDTVFIFVRER